MENKELLDIAEYAELSPTFTNWFMDKPHQVVRELYKFYKLKQDILDCLQKVVDEDEMYYQDFDDKYSEDDCKVWCPEKMIWRIGELGLAKEGLFE